MADALRVDAAPTDAEVAAFGRLYAEGCARVWRLLGRLGVAPEHLEDVAHDVFVTAWRRRECFEGRSALTTWLLGIAVRVASDYRRGRRVLEELPEALPAGGDLVAELERRDARRRLAVLLERLVPERRTVLVLVDVEGCSVPEVAESLGLNVNTAYTRLRAARADFNRLLKEPGAPR